MVKAIILDFDGVIHNTFEFHRNKLQKFTGVKVSCEDFKKMHDGNFFDHQNNVLKNVNWPWYRDFVYADEIRLKIIPKIKTMLLDLSEKFGLFIISGAGSKNISDYLKNNGVDVFKEVLGFEANASKIEKFNFLFEKYGLFPDDCIFVTDTLGDILEANVVNVKTIAVDFGFHDKTRLEKGNPLAIISSFSELSKYLK